MAARGSQPRQKRDRAFREWEAELKRVLATMAAPVPPESAPAWVMFNPGTLPRCPIIEARNRLHELAGLSPAPQPPPRRSWRARLIAYFRKLSSELTVRRPPEPVRPGSRSARHYAWMTTPLSGPRV